jgi:hypothetical protein
VGVLCGIVAVVGLSACTRQQIEQAVMLDAQHRATVAPVVAPEPTTTTTAPLATGEPGLVCMIGASPDQPYDGGLVLTATLGGSGEACVVIPSDVTVVAVPPPTTLP